jgi:hypothetical protein
MNNSLKPSPISTAELELEIEYYCDHKGLNPLEATPLVGARLVGASMDHLSVVLQATGAARPAAPAVEMVDRAHGVRTSAAAKRGPGKAAANQVSRRSTANHSYWDRMTPDERKKEMAKRRRKMSPEARARWGGKKRGGKKGKRKQPNAALYQARHVAKKNGTPLPPLPKEQAA